ncbi:MAG: hypothetical protein AAF741_02220 [Bacteroidota bacterium]
MSSFHKLLALSISAFLVLALALSCDDEEFVLPDSEPRIVAMQQLRSMPGSDITITATITDPAGLSSVNLDYQPWSIAEQNSLNGTDTRFDFSYVLSVPAAAEMGSVHELLLTATNMNGISLTDTLTLTLDEDVTMPVFQNTTPEGMVFLGEGPDVTLEFTTTDDGRIASVEVVGANISDIIPLSTDEYNYSRELNIQTPGVYEFDIRITDNDGNVTEDVIKIAAFEPFPAFFATDVTTDEDLNADLFGVPAIADAVEGVDSTGKLFVARFYSEQAGTEIRLLPSRETFGTLTLGASSEPGKLEIATDASVSPIVLPQVGYYEVNVDLRDLSYSVNPYTPTTTPFPLVAFIGTGVRVDGQSTCVSNADGSEACFWWGSGKELTVDPENPLIFRGVVELYDHDPVGTGNNAFIMNANLSGWSPFWRFDDGSSPDLAVPGGGVEFIFDSSAYGFWEATFDSHLNRLVLTPSS